MNALYLKNPKRIEALSYMILISIMVLYIAEYIVRRDLIKNDNEKIIGPGKIKMSRSTLLAVFDIFVNVRIRVIKEINFTKRQFISPLSDSIKKVLKYLGISVDIFIQGVNKT